LNARAGDADGARSFAVEQRVDGVAVIRMDVPTDRVNLLNLACLEELDALLEGLERVPQVRAIVLASAKPDSFVVGPDIAMLGQIRTINDGIDRSRAGQVLMDRLASLRVPVVVAIHGSCLGSGLELALACHGRVASQDRSTLLGLPEVTLGLLPAMGGTQRLPRLIGSEAALNLMLTGELVHAERARALGLVDATVSAEELVETAAARARDLARQDRSRRATAGERFRSVLVGAFGPEGNPVARRIRFTRIRREIAERSRGNYPALECIVQAVEVAHERDQRKGFWAESRAFGELATSHQAGHLLYLHGAECELGDEASGLVTMTGREPLRRLGVLGSGTLAERISVATVSEGRLEVVLEARRSGPPRSAESAVEHELAALVSAGRMSPAERASSRQRLSVASSLAGFRDCELVVETAAEDLGLKRQLLLEMEDRGHPDVVFATTANAWSARRVAEVSRHPWRVVGVHFAESAAGTRFLEVMAGERTSPAAVAACVELGARQGRTVLVVRDEPGGYVPRLTASLLVEGLHLLGEGVSSDTLEEALRDWGFGDELASLLRPKTMRRWAEIGAILAESLGPRLQPPALGRRIAQAMRREHGADDPSDSQARTKRRARSALSALLGAGTRAELRGSEVAQRCALRFVDEAARCYGQGVIASARDGDVGAVRGAGFPAFRGGPFRYVDEVGAGEIVRRLERLGRTHGTRFEPAPLLTRMARGEGTFHGLRALPPGTERELPR
jgi:3-hydroxyacyl-CoA dehydrogenase / enoyl-CoA hydratase / 3-hydroxybutyryl-CoA epimerase